MRKSANGSLPRSERNCSNCDASRIQGRELRCWVDPPQPCMVGALPPRLEGLPPQPIIIGVVPPTWAWYCCPRWALMQPDHPDFVAVSSDVAEPAVEAEVH